MMKDVDTDLSKIFRSMHESCDPPPGDRPPGPKIKPVMLKGDPPKRSILQMVAMLSLAASALLYLMLLYR
ncbi:hypothetical protein [Sphingobium sp. KCTC 72723]|uniref:hypothetical protein n=1 Tax=Sphingobium sp. KCTC 72723 TaxID=2733867 RepID=UPI00165DC4E0|nr:hypothetical protein [Sphingobium sp. KCTC 72723]